VFYKRKKKDVAMAVISLFIEEEEKKIVVDMPRTPS